MDFKKLIVSEDNKLVLEDYNLTSDDAEILDINKSLKDVATDVELQNFIKENAIDQSKVYFICVKEDFGTNEQIIENIPDVKSIYKVIKKVFKKNKNVYFFVYNTYLKNDIALNPSLETPSVFESQNAEVSDINNYDDSLNAQEQVDYYDQEQYQDNYVDDGQQNYDDQQNFVNDQNVEENYQELVSENNEFVTNEENNTVELNNFENVNEYQNDDLMPEQEVIVSNDELQDETVSLNDVPVEEEVVIQDEIPFNQEVVIQEETPIQEEMPVQDEIYVEQVVPTEDNVQYQEDVQVVSNDTLEDNVVDYSSENEVAPEENFEDVIDSSWGDEVKVVTQPSEPEVMFANESPAEIIEPTEEESLDIIDQTQIEDDIDWNNIEVIETDQNPEEEIVEVETIPANIVDSNNDDNWSDMESSNNVFDNDIIVSNQSETPDEIKSFDTLESLTEITDGSIRDGSNDISIPESYFDTENENQLSYEDYNEFQNDYELNVHALKSIYDFIWRMLVLNNYNLKLNDLLYLAVNNLDAFSIGQSDFVRQTANKAESLFDLILQLDIKLEFNNSLFYIYLAEFFAIKSNKIIVNQKFLNTLSIWVDKSSKNKFVQQVEQFVNYSTVYNKKIIFSYFVELANFIKGCIPSIKPSLSLVDVHRILSNKSKKVREGNVFGFIVDKINEIFAKNGITIESELIDTPDSIFGDDKDKYSDDVDQNWKTQLCELYKRLVLNIRDYVLSKGNNEMDIFNIYIDIKDLRMYHSPMGDVSALSPSTIQSLEYDKNYSTIGDAFNRTNSIVPSQNTEIDYENFTSYIPPVIESGNNNFDLSELSNGEVNMEKKYIDETLVQPAVPKFSAAELEDSMSKRIEEYEKKIKQNIERIEAERKQLREKMEALKNL